MGFVMGMSNVARDTINPDLIFKLASKGLSQRMMAQSIGCAVDTMMIYINDNPNNLDAYKRGKAKDIQEVVNKLKEIALNGNLGAICFYLKNKDPANWKEQHDVNHTGGLSINVAALKAPLEGQYSTIKSNT